MHSFPKDAARRSLWIKALRLKDWEPTQYSAVCSMHFREADIDRTSLSTIRLRDSAVPSIFFIVAPVLGEYRSIDSQHFQQYTECGATCRSQRGFSVAQNACYANKHFRGSKKTSSIQENDNRPPLSSSGHSHHVGIPPANGQRKLECQNLSPSVVDFKTDFGDKLDCNPEEFLRDAPPLKPLIARAIVQSPYRWVSFV
ncbi:uncharacterized protein LOC126212717 [Schistocerca nitens]|uniref:uncharacterized protein LOC126212717 n=1 Tax=Schistocerca nitens TaxID=7011 RepID=UPI002117A7EB|nr:uncharacterized protein LOC126212717 [Schistocerca nitens]